MCGAGGGSRERELLNGRESRVESEGGGVWCGQLAVGAELGRGLHSLAFLVFSWSFLVFSCLFLVFSFLRKQKNSIGKGKEKEKKTIEI